MRNQRANTLKLWLRSAAFLIIASAFCNGARASAVAQTKGTGVHKGRASKASPRKVTVAELKSMDPLKEAFQRDGGKVRLVMILSPT